MQMATMSDNILKTIQSILQDVIAPDLREIKAQQAAMQQQMDLRFKAMDEQMQLQIGGLRQEIAIQINGLNNNMAHLEKQLLSAYAASQLQVELTGTKAIVDIRERVAVLESQRAA
jgi:hypothetical protein